MKTNETLNRYSATLVDIQLLKNNNAEVFKQLEILEQDRAELEIKLKEKIKENGVDVENDIVKITISEAWKKYYDYELFIGNASQEEVNSLVAANGVEREIKKEIFDECVKQGLISGNTKQSSFKEEQMTTRIIIKSKLK